MLLVARAWHGRNERRLEVLEGLGLVELTKGHEGRRPRTWVAITREGRSALATEMAALRASWSGSTPRTEHAR
jgi:DNA-binding PadR family transcriptional regulator